MSEIRIPELGPLSTRLLAEIGQIAGDAARGEWVQNKLRQMGLEPHSDELGDVWAGSGGLLIMAHLDTVLSPGPIRRDKNRWYGPSIGDNSAGVAVLIALAAELTGLGCTVAFSVGEEGLGNLRGARALVKALKPAQVIAVDGYLPGVVSRSVGSHRLRARFMGAGGHAWGDREAASPVPALGQALAQMYALPRSADTSLNVGRLWGGEAINAIPREVGLELDLRALEPDQLNEVSRSVRTLLMEAARKHSVRLELEVLGERPAGMTATPAMLEAARAALLEVGLEAQFTAGSTDASAGVEAGIPALTLSVYRGGGAHTPEEWVEPASLELGARALHGLVRRLQGG
ncbi:M20/M25/M40 family metallo-hydrolase [Meiothermus granaticius]|uniref:Carboxypeptidase G2 n=1 Tax=Meiothermus granaticius NBRC 107808 TaxID=1227551 RepID=A0A399F2H9_9DEIN|nr:M20/M25/M40 family metallo-hydrolase [Meiothermus granaticius]MCL6526816.1 M20/M25/M40 family metallo-hydrolase [Thermaceae bacterium]RIH90914.1 Carboxypeptidase G2 [Meiothermus granaticius NBRC 107808]GEM87192.1 peptidase M20 [Meiothermus granaticius NBRC 107808]